MHTKDGFNCCYNVQTAVDSSSHLIAETLSSSVISKNPEIIRICLAAGVLPTRYEDTCIKLEVRELAQISCFSKNDDGTVTCPMMNIMTRTRQRGKQSVYRNHDARRQCTNRCTSSKNAKGVCFSEDTQYIAVQMYGKTRRKLNSIPDGISLHPNNHNLDRKAVPKKVSLKLLENPEKIHLRMCTVVHPFGTVKWYGGAHYLLCKGIRKVTGEIGLSFLSYNLRRAINMIGTKSLIEGILAG